MYQFLLIDVSYAVLTVISFIMFIMGIWMLSDKRP